MVAMSLLPESPVWLKWKGNSLAAEAASRRLLGNSQQAAELAQTEEGENEPLVSSQSNEVRDSSWLQSSCQRHFHTS